MRITVRAKPRARQPKVEQRDETHFVVAVREPPEDGRANAAIVKALAAHFGVAPAQVTIVAGHAGKTKIVDIARP
ncbi:MAG: UPF0235 protein [Dehalococcoidia bacterium]|nr:MAG: UPF0235 protein [Dehalococcoidia bacterium]